MNIPLDNLYHWIYRLAKHPVILYVFRPHGSKDISDLRVSEEINMEHCLLPSVVCHDQEPLNFSLYQFDHDQDRLANLIRNYYQRDGMDQHTVNEIVDLTLYFFSQLEHFPEFKPHYFNCLDRSDWTILLHSEMNSQDVADFSRTGFRPVYYWAHAVIARDWYRFAQYDLRLKNRIQEKIFLVYCRDWTPIREYRLKFLDLLLDANLVDHCVISTQHTNIQGVHLCDYEIQDPRFAVNTEKLLQISDNNTPPTASADYDIKHITTTHVSVVLETVIDNKIHLTEKILRAIACTHPFVLAAGPEALKYLRHYGFKTFADFWDESYDQEPDTVLRLKKIVATMTQIKSLTKDQWCQVQAIAEYNQRHFFSEEFINQVTAELNCNFNQAIDFVIENRGQTYWKFRKMLRRNNMLDDFSILKTNIEYQTVLELRRDRSRRFKNHPSPIIGQ